MIKNYLLYFLFSLVDIMTSCSQMIDLENQEENYNHLKDESSPYLLMHAKNPVDWYPWKKEALLKAKNENKLLIISIGYSACHWCHVMEKESFGDTSVANLMNKYFVSIKVDREERPDIDQIYMEAAQLISGNGGWPLNAIALPDGKPIFAGTYFPKEQWINLLKRIQEIYENEKDLVLKQADQLLKVIRENDLVKGENTTSEFSDTLAKASFNQWMLSIDFERGGQQRAPKFPLPIGYDYLLNYYHWSKDSKALKAVTVTLDNMAAGGIYDHIGGGFARYSTDDEWKVPHFEKMLYDNAQLISLYAKAFRLTKKPLYKDIVYQTLAFVERELTSPEGAFYSSIDADSEDEEGKFYVWKKKEIDKVLGKDTQWVKQYYQVNKKGNWENGNNILYCINNDSIFAQQHGFTYSEFKQKIEQVNNILLQVRNKRIRPALDDKILTSWNALMLKAYASAYNTFGEKEFLEKSLINAHFIHSKMMSREGKLWRNYKNGKISINAFLDDYALLIDALVTLYQATFDQQWLVTAKKLTDYVIVHFYDKTSGMFFYTSDLDDPLIARKMEIYDNVIPCSNSIMANNLYKLGQYFYSRDYLDKSKIMLNNMKRYLIRGSTYTANWQHLLLYYLNPPFEVAIVGKDFEKKRRAFAEQFLPNVFLMGGKNEGKLPLLKGKLRKRETAIYVCKDKTCRLPVNEVKKALEQINTQ